MRSSSSGKITSAKSNGSVKFCCPVVEQPGLVHVFSAMEPCASYTPWHDKKTGCTYLKPATSKCLHYYFYFVWPTTWVVLSARADVGTVSASVLLQRPQILGADAAQQRYRIQLVGQQLRTVPRLESGASSQRRAQAGKHPSHPGCGRYAILPSCRNASAPTIGALCRSNTPRISFSPASGFNEPVRRIVQDRHSQHKVRTGIDFSGSKTPRRIPGRTGQQLFHPNRGHLHQASHRAGGHQDVRQARAGASGGNDGQRCFFFQAPPEGWNTAMAP